MSNVQVYFFFNLFLFYRGIYSWRHIYPDFHRSKNEGQKENIILKRSSKAAKSSENIEVKNVPQEQEISLEHQELSEVQIIPVDQDSVKKQVRSIVCPVPLFL